MHLEKFRVQNYKKIRDTGWISCLNLTVFVGKNEAGKSAIFRGLSKLNPSDGETYDGLKEFPRRRFTDEFNDQDWPVASGLFGFSNEDKTALIEICPPMENIKKAKITRHYSGRLTFDFEPCIKITGLTAGKYLETLEPMLEQIQSFTAPDGMGEPLRNIKNTFVNQIQGQVNQLKQTDKKIFVETSKIDALIKLLSSHMNEKWQKKLITPLLDSLKELVQTNTIRDTLNNAEKWIEDNIPQFIYFDRYDVIESEIHLPTFLKQLNSKPNAPRVRTTHCLFKHVGLDVKKLSTLGRHQPGEGINKEVRRYIDERAIHFSSASNAMTRKFTEWWEQRKHIFRYQVDGDYFRIWVSDDLDPSEIELDQRSLGMQYFFSFYTVFLVESKETHRNSILLLDEPGLHSHGTLQSKIITFIDKLSKDNQTLYSTHSPFLIDGDHLERARAVYEDEDGTTKVSEDVWLRDKDSLFPLQAALGYQLAQSLFLSQRQLIVEGITDYWLIKCISQALELKKMTTLRNDITLIPAAGVSKLLPLASMLIGHDIEIGALIDGDEPARQAGKKLVAKLLVGEDRRCVFIGDFVEGYEHAEIEDVFTEEVYFNAVASAYSNIKIVLNKEEKEIDGIVDKIKAYFERKNLGHFEKWKVASVLRDEILNSPDNIPDQVYDIMSRIFDTVNNCFSKSSQG